MKYIFRPLHLTRRYARRFARRRCSTGDRRGFSGGDGWGGNGSGRLSGLYCGDIAVACREVFDGCGSRGLSGDGGVLAGVEILVQIYHGDRDSGRDEDGELACMVICFFGWWIESLGEERWVNN